VSSYVFALDPVGVLGLMNINDVVWIVWPCKKVDHFVV
jgi:hypothetical protein